MKTFSEIESRRRHLRPVVVAAVVAPLLCFSSIAAAAQAPAPCCFTNPAYNGICVVRPGDQESCKTILEYLNNPNSSGKTYCGGTGIRGGWKETKCPQASNPKNGRSKPLDRDRLPACPRPDSMPARDLK